MAIILIFHEDHPVIEDSQNGRRLIHEWHQPIGLDTKVSVSKAWWQLAEARKATLEHVREPTGFSGPAIFGVSLVRFVLCSGHMDHVYMMICTQFVPLCNQSVSGMHVQLQKPHPSAC